MKNTIKKKEQKNYPAIFPMEFHGFTKRTINVGSKDTTTDAKTKMRGQWKKGETGESELGRGGEGRAR